MTIARRRARLATAALGLAALVGLAAWKSRGEPPPPAAPAASAAALEIEPGTIASYTASLSVVSSAALPGLASPLASRIDVEGDVTLEAHGTEAAGRVISLRWTAVRRAALEALGKPSEAALEAELRAAPAVLVLGPGAHLVELRIAEGASPAARTVQRALATEIAATAEGVWGTADVVHTSLGRARVQRAGAGFSHADYTELDAVGVPEEVRVESVGRGARQGSIVADLVHDEVVSATGAGPRVEAVTSELHLALHLLRSSSGPARAAPAAAMEPEQPTPPPAEARAASLERRAAGVTAQSAFADVRTAGLLPREAGTAWVWRDAAWLELHPEAAAPLVARAEAELSIVGLAAAFDVIVVSGTPGSQRALVASLERLRTRTDGAFEILIQRLGHLREPTAETLGFVAREHEEGKTPARRGAAAYALGALARHALAAEPGVEGAPRDAPPTAPCESAPCWARRGLATLEGELARAATVDERVTALRAIGNGGQSASFGAVAPHARSSDVDVRRAVAAAVRAMEGGPVVDLLLELARDADGGVAREALSSLFRKVLDDDDWKALEALVDGGLVPSDAHSTLIQGLATRSDDEAHAEAVLAKLLVSDRVSPRLKLQIESRLQR